MRRLGFTGVLFITCSCVTVPTLAPDSSLAIDLGYGVTARMVYMEEAGDPILNVTMTASTAWGMMPVAVDGLPDVEAILHLESGAEVRGEDRSKGFPAWDGSLIWHSSVRFRFPGGDAGDPPRTLALRLYEWKGTFEVETAGRLTRVVRGDLSIGESTHVGLEHDRLELDLKLTAQPSTFILIVDIGVPGMDTQNWDEGDLKTTMRYGGGGESHGFVLQPGFGAWVGCLHHMRTQATLYFPAKIEAGEAQSLEVRLRNSRVLLRIVHP